MNIFKVISYIVIYLTFIVIGLYLNSTILSIIIIPTILTFSLIISSHLFNRGYAEKSVVSAIKFLTYMFVSSLVFIFIFIFNDFSVENIIAGIIGSSTIIGYLVAISHTGRDRHEVRR